MTVRFKNELVRNITIKLGYANAKVSACLYVSSNYRLLREGLRFTNVRTRVVHVQAATGHIARTRRTTPLANDPDAVTA